MAFRVALLKKIMKIELYCLFTLEVEEVINGCVTTDVLGQGLPWELDIAEEVIQTHKSEIS